MLNPGAAPGATEGLMMSKLSDLANAGTAPWLDFVDRKFLAAGGLQKLVDQDGVTGVTSNPTIFEKAMGAGDAYDEGFAAFDAKNPGAEPMARYEAQAIQDIQSACDVLRPVYDRLDSKDGYVSLEVSPYLAMKGPETAEEAARLWDAVDRPNLMIKIPGTADGVRAIRDTIAKGINVNVTLLFAIEAYKKVALAYVEGLEERVSKDMAIDRIASVASFFVSRIDGKIDDKIDAGTGGDEAKALKGKVAIANAKLAYAWFEELIASDRWQKLAAKGAQPQRLLWASTGVKNPDYPDTLYVDTLIGPDTVNTMPPKTMDAFRDHGTVAQTLTQDVDGARKVLADAERLGLDLNGVTTTLVEEGVASFSKSFDDLLEVIKGKQPAAA
jgi:transaldolase/glucose-6-phosphate isomerase